MEPGPGGSFGGPVIRDKTFYFFSFQGTRQVNGLTGASSLTLPPIPLDRSAASLGRVFAGQKGARGGTAIAADGSNINPVALALLNAKLPDGSFVVPSPQIAGTGVNYTVSKPSRFNEDQYIANIDHQFGSHNHVAFKALIANQPTYKPFGSANVPGFGSTQDFKDRIFSLTDTHILSNNLVNEARVGVSRVLGVVIPDATVLLKDIGMQRFNSADYPDIPLITVTGAFAIGYDWLGCSTRTGDGMDAVLAACAGDTSALVGQSGVGKSSLIRRLVPKADIEVGELVREEEGRHTTTASHLFDLPDGGSLIDSPGVRDFAPAIDRLDSGHLGFIEVARLAPECRFTDCRHMREPGCAVITASEAGTMHPRRYESYRRLRRLFEELTEARGPQKRNR